MCDCMCRVVLLYVFDACMSYLVQRKKTLLQEYKLRHKTNRFIDRRLGEYEEDMTPEEKMIQRFVKQKQVSRIITG